MGGRVAGKVAFSNGSYKDGGKTIPVFVYHLHENVIVNLSLVK